MDKTIKSEILFLTLGEATVAALTVLGYYLLSLAFGDNVIFDYTVITGALLGAAVSVLNFIILTVSINRAINGFVEEIGQRNMSEEEAERFTRENQAKVKLAITSSYIIRTLLMLGTLVGAFLLAWFNPIATAIPLFAYKPVLYVIEIIKRKRGGC